MRVIEAHASLDSANSAANKFASAEIEICYTDDEDGENADEEGPEKNDHLEGSMNSDGCVSITFRDEDNDFAPFEVEVAKMELKGGSVR